MRSDINEDWAHAGIVEAGSFVFLSYCVGNIGQSIENQIIRAFDHLESALGQLVDTRIGRTNGLFISGHLEHHVMEKVIKERFNGQYPARKSIQTEFAHRGWAGRPALPA